MRFLRATLLTFLCVAAANAAARAGTTGTLSGRVVDRTGKPVAAARVTVASPSQSATATTDSSGAFTFASLAPDTYAVSVERPGYAPESFAGITIVSDQARTLRLELQQSPETIANVRARVPAGLVRPGTTSSVYSVDAVRAQQASTLLGTGSLNQAYGAIASVPGVAVPQNQQGWYQFVYVRGGAQDQNAWELDGIPVNRAYDNAPQTMLSSLGQQELQIYTGGVPATSDASGIAGYINQVIKTGTSPGYANGTLGVGTPAFYHQASFEIGGATPDRRFSWYFGTMGANQGYRYLNQFDGAGVTGFFYPFSIPTTNGYVYAPAPGATPALFSPGNAYGLSTTQDRETILNLHVAIPHHRDGGSDDLQLLYDTGGILDGFTSSVNDLGGPALFAKAGLGPLPWANGIVYTGPLMAPANAASFQRYYFPSSPATGMPDAVQPPNLRDTNANGFAVVKLQYQRNFSSSAFLRIFGYTMYSSWFEYGPVSANLPWGDSVADYENIAHTGGVNAKFVDQVAPAHLLTAAGSWSSSTMMRYSTTGGFPASSIGSYANAFVGSNGLCYNWKTGAQIGCYDACVNPSTGVDQTGGCASSFTPLRGTIPSSPGGSIFSPSPAYACGGPAPPPACAHDPRWLMTTNGYSANLDTVAPVFTAGAIDDYWSPSDRFSLKAGLRAETYTYDLANTAVGNPARAFWFNSYNAQYCFGPGLAEPVLRTPNKQGALLGPCPANTTPVNMADASGGTLSSTQWQPRLGAVDAMGSNDVLRASWGVYAQPANTAWAQFNTVQPDLAHYLGTEFLGYGFNTPVHDERPARSYNSDLSWEHHFKDTGVSFKLTPFYRSTADQLQSFDINSLTGLRSGLNVGRQVSQGVEFQLQAGDPTHDGWNAQLSYTYTHSRIRFSNFSNGRNVIDNLNNYIQQYNSYTKACRIPDPALCGTYAGNARPVFDNGGTIVANPYYDNPAQPLLDRNAWYVPYDVIPAPFAGANGHDFPNVAALVVGYKHDRWTITPTLALTSGAEYGSPLVWPGYVPQFCTQVNRGTRTAIGSSCASGPATVAPLPYIFTPDPYSGRFDDLGAFRQPSEITLNIASSYRVSPRVTARVELLDLVDHCILRGYAWETPGICTYAELPSSALAPAGNFVPLASAPPQLRYPYGMWLNNTEVGALGTSVPMQAIFEVDVSL